MVIRVVATADNHLNRFYDRMAPATLQARRKYLRDGFRAAVDYALAIQAQVFCICGDLFDTPAPRNIERAFVAQCFAALRAAGITICAIGGNHDTPAQSTDQGGVAPLEVYQKLGAIHTFDMVTTITSTTITIDGMTLAIGGLGTNPAALPGIDPIARLSWKPQAAGATTSILLLHGQVEGYTVPDDQGAIFSREHLRDQTDADLILIGDIHRARRIPLAPGRQIIIPGATERMTFGESTEVPGFMLLTYTPADGWTPERIQLKGQPRVELTIRAAELPVEDPTAALIARVLAVADDQTLVRLALEGIIERARYRELHFRALQDALSRRVFHSTLETGGLLLEEAGDGTTHRGVRLSQSEELRSLADELIASSSDPLDQAITRDALLDILQQIDARA